MYKRLPSGSRLVPYTMIYSTNSLLQMVGKLV